MRTYNEALYLQFRKLSSFLPIYVNLTEHRNLLKSRNESCSVKKVDLLIRGGTRNLETEMFGKRYPSIFFPSSS